jgi:hypothetical protein
MKSIEQKRTEALARRIKDLEFWQKCFNKTPEHEYDEQAKDHFKSKIKAAQRDIANLIKKLGRSV